jgi:tetratricopeptide (TPR) repeat protein
MNRPATAKVQGSKQKRTTSAGLCRPFVDSHAVESQDRFIMANRLFTVVLFVGSCLVFLSPAGAQQAPYGSLFGPFRRDRNGSESNPARNQNMIEADKSQQAGDFPHVIELTDEILRQNPRDSAAYYLRGSAKVELGARQGDGKLIRDGIADAREAIRYDSQRTAMYYLPYLHGMKNLAVLENRKEHAETAINIATQILGVTGISNDDKANLLFQRAQAEGWLGKTDPAVADYEEALRLVPTHFGARAAVADILAAAGKNDQALAAYNKLVESFPESPLSYNNRGMFLQRQGKYDDAITDFTRAVERDPNYFYSYTNRGFTLLQMDNPTAAQVDFTQSLKLNPQQAFVYNLRGLSKLALGDLTGAIQDQRAAVEMNPKDPVARGDLGFLLSFADDFAAALPEFDAALQIDPQFRYLNPWKVVALKRLGKTEDLKGQFGDSLKKDPKQRDWVDHLVAYLLGAETEANLLAATNDPKDPLKNDELCEGEYFIGVTKAAAGKPTEAQDAFQRAVATKSRQLSAFRGAQYALKKANVTPGAPASVAVPTTTGAKTEPNAAK